MTMNLKTTFTCIAGLALAATAFAADPFQPAHKLTGIPYNSGFPDGHDPYNSMGCASNGKIYYVLSADKYDVGARMFSFDPKKNEVKFVADLTEACGEKDDGHQILRVAAWPNSP